MEPPPPLSPPPIPPPAYRLQSIAGITLATALGTPAAGGIVLAINYWKWGQKALAAAAVVAGFLATAVLAWLAWVLPTSVPAAAFLVPQVIGGYFLAKSLQGRRVDAHVAAGGGTASNWIGAGIGLAFCALLVGAFAVWIFSSGVNPRVLIDTQQSVDFGHGQEVFYSRGATRNDAQDFGEALKREGYFDDITPTSVFIAGRPGAREISFLADEGAWDDEANVEWARDMGELIAPAIGGKPLTVRMLDLNLNEEKRLQIE
jgi:hypothetical protein